MLSTDLGCMFSHALAFSIFWCCIPCSECCNLLCVRLNVHILGAISYFIRQLQGMCFCCIVRSLKHL